MIKVNIQKEKEIQKKITFSGHAMYDDFGKDIVCAAVSSIVTTTINGILILNENSLVYEIKENGLIIDDIHSENETQKLIENMINLLKELEENYPKNIKVK